MGIISMCSDLVEAAEGWITNVGDGEGDFEVVGAPEQFMRE